MTLSDSTVVENQYAETDFDKIIEATIRNYSKMLVEVGKGQAARAYLTGSFYTPTTRVSVYDPNYIETNRSLLAGRYTGISDETEETWLGNGSMTRADGLDRSSATSPRA